MAALAVLVTAMMVSGMAIESAFVGCVNCAVLLPFLLYGGKKLRELVSPVPQASNEKPKYGKTHMSFRTSEEQRGGAEESGKVAAAAPVDLNAAVKTTYVRERKDGAAASTSAKRAKRRCCCYSFLLLRVVLGSLANKALLRVVPDAACRTWARSRKESAAALRSCCCGVQQK